MHDRRQCFQQDVGVIAGQGEISADEEAISSTVERYDAAVLRSYEEGVDINGRRFQITCETEGSTAWQQKAISRLHV
jgi:hypothetical protein